MAGVVALLALAASATSLRNGFTYDDRWIIAENDRVHQLRALWTYFTESYWPMRSGAALYRPVVIVLYSVQWVVGNGSPLIFHAVNVLLAAACAVAVFWVGGFILPIGVAWLAAALFAVHPVHVEAIANTVGQAELWAALVVLLACGLYLRDRRDGALRRETGLAICALFLVGLFTKEHVIVLPALLVAIELLICTDGTWRSRLDRLRLLLWPLAAIVALYLAVRVQVIGDVAGDVEHPVLRHRTMIERVRIMMSVFPEYARLLLVPARLYADYSPRQFEVYPSPQASMLAGTVLLGSAAVLFVLALLRSRPAAFGLAWLVIVIAPVTNILVPTGILVAERTLFLPSVGAMFALAVGADLVRRRLIADRSPLRRALPALLVAALVAGVWRSATRNAFWHDSNSAFAQMAVDAPLNFKAHYAYGGQLFEEKRPREGEIEWRMAIALYPTYHGVYVDLAHRYRMAHLCDAALPLYRKAIELEPELPVVVVSIAACQLELARWHEARTTARVAIADGLYKKAFRYIADRADSALVENDSLDATIGQKWLDRRRPHGAGAAAPSPK